MGDVAGDVVGRAFRVGGVVQGVGFRWFTRETAARMGLTGWVANRPDGAVHGEVFGGAGEVATFLAAIQRGPTLGQVTTLEVSEVLPQSLTGFEIRK